MEHIAWNSILYHHSSNISIDFFVDSKVNYLILIDLFGIFSWLPTNCLFFQSNNSRISISFDLKRITVWSTSFIPTSRRFDMYNKWHKFQRQNIVFFVVAFIVSAVKVFSWECFDIWCVCDINQAVRYFYVVAKLFMYILSIEQAKFSASMFFEFSP